MSGKLTQYLSRSLQGLKARLITPILDGKHPPEYTARGVAVGLFMALTPTVGLQIAIIVALWTLVRTFRRQWDFNLVVASAWTFVTNVFTVAPAYYVFVQTGRIMMGRWENLRGYEAYATRFDKTEIPHLSWYEGIWRQTIEIFDVFGLPMFVGCLPWAIGGAWIGYVWSLRLISRHRARHAGTAPGA